MVSTDKSKILRGAFEPNLINLLLETENQGDESVNFELLVFLGQILMINPGFTEEVLRFISKTFIGFAKLTIRVQSLLDQTLLTQNAELIGKLYNISFK
jgi:sporulation protein YlmC with PRC-barrel domain